MIICIKQRNLTVSIDLGEENSEKSISCEEVMLAAFDAISRLYSDRAVVRAYYRIDPDSKSLRGDDDQILKMAPRYHRE